MRKFYFTYKDRNIEDNISATVLRISKTEISATVLRNFNLSWSHYLTLVRMDNENERKFYEIESVKNNWSVRELKRQYDSIVYETCIKSEYRKS